MVCRGGGSVARYGRKYAEFAANGARAGTNRSAAPVAVWSGPHQRWEDGSRVTEAQLRLSLFALNATLIDLPVPFYVPGTYTSHLRRDPSDPPVLLLRSSHVAGAPACTCRPAPTRPRSQGNASTK